MSGEAFCTNKWIFTWASEQEDKKNPDNLWGSQSPVTPELEPRSLIANEFVSAVL